MLLNRLQRYYDRGSSPGRDLSLSDEFDQLFQQFFAEPATIALAPGFGPALDLYEEDDKLIVRVELPGLKKEDIDIALDDNVLTVTGERKEESKPANARVHRRERTAGRFQRGIALPYPVNGENVKATYTEGILTVTLAKAEEAKAKQIPIDIN